MKCFEENVASFSQISGHAATVVLEDRRTVNADWYTTVCLPEVIQKCRRNIHKRRIIFHHDNASSHTAARTAEFLAEENIDPMHHPPYSPDLTPCGVFLFLNVKKSCLDSVFQTEAAVAAYREVVDEIPNVE